MSFNNLEERFNATVNTLYAGGKTKFSGGLPSSGLRDEPYLTRNPGESRLGISTESRGLPIVSSARDVKRLSLFQLSNRGLLFLAKQQLLQTGNTFESTRLINPLFVVGNAVPFLHIRRNLKASKIESFKGVYTQTDLRKIGQVQKETYDNLSTGQSIKSSWFKKIPIIGQAISAFNSFTSGRSVGDAILIDWTKSRPELAKASYPNSISTGKDVQPPAPFLNKTDALEKQKNEYFGKTSNQFLKYFTADTNGSIQLRESHLNARDRSQDGNGNRKKLSYIRDPLNTRQRGNSPTDTLLPYSDLNLVENTPKDDPIVVSFAMGSDKHVQFRAFIKDIVQTADPVYSEHQYIGRIEKFVSYNSVQRKVSFKLGIIAFSDQELDVVWKRINYLTGMVFPYGFNKGILQPNVVRMTIGNLYVDQPGYVTSLQSNYTDITETWDIDRDVPIGATMDIAISIIEKRTKIASSPFYGITENMMDANGQSEFPPVVAVSGVPQQSTPTNQLAPTGPIVQSWNMANKISPSALSLISRNTFSYPSIFGSPNG